MCVHRFLKGLLLLNRMRMFAPFAAALMEARGSCRASRDVWRSLVTAHGAYTQCPCEIKCSTSVQSKSVCPTIIEEVGTSDPNWETKSSTSTPSKCAHHIVDASQTVKRELDTRYLPWNQMEATQAENRKERFYREQNEKLRRYSRLQNLRTLKPRHLYSTCPSHYMYMPFDIANEVELEHLTLKQPSEDKYSSTITLDEGRCPSTSLEKK